MKKAITRVWHGKTALADAEGYLAVLMETGIRDNRNTPGNLSAEIWRRIDGTVCHFWTVTGWRSIEDIKRFAGDQYERARYYPEDERYLLEKEETVSHYESWLSDA